MSTASLRADHKMRYGGILENPWISKIQRAMLDAGRVGELKDGLAKLEYKSVLDVGCGLGECSAVNKELYVGLDNSFSRVQFAKRRYSHCEFLMGDAVHLPFEAKSFDMGMLIDTSHHLTDEELKIVLHELKRVCRKYIIVSDPVVLPGQNALSRFFYSLDRGACFRSPGESQKIFKTIAGLEVRDTFSCKTFPGLYVHQAFILQIASH